VLLLSVLSYALAFCYVFIQGRFYWYWVAFIEASPLNNNQVKQPVRWSVIVPARNEASHILTTLQALAGQGAELIVINDHSTDQTAQLVATQNGVRLINLPEGVTGKKAALTYALAKATGEWIATVDADVSVKEGWLKALDEARSHSTVAIAGPVMLAPTTSWFERWQALDFCGMMLITAASLRMGNFAMGNGANLAFSKNAFYEVGGYESPKGKESVSGDDMVLLGKMLEKFPGQIAFAKTADAIVKTPPQSNVASFIQQRWRWSAKTGLNQQAQLTFTLAMLVIFGFLDEVSLYFAWGCKLIVDYIVLRTAARHFERQALLDWTYPFQSFLHALYVAGVGTLSLMPLEFEWKGRKARR